MKALLFILAAFAATPTYLKLTPTKPVSLPAGEKGTVKVSLEIQKGFHIQANPAVSKQYIATTLEVKGDESVSTGTPSYPKGVLYRLQGSDTELLVYGGKVEIELPLEVVGKAKVGKHDLAGTLRYQPCDEKNCFFPQKLPVTVPVLVKMPSPH